MGSISNVLMRLASAGRKNSGKTKRRQSNMDTAQSIPKNIVFGRFAMARNRLFLRRAKKLFSNLESTGKMSASRPSTRTAAKAAAAKTAKESAPVAAAFHVPTTAFKSR